MPFTFAHPAIILPFKYLPKKWFSFTGLIIGSLTPDFEYFIRMRIQSNYSHTIYGIFWFDLPLALLLCFVYHNIIRNQLFNNLPSTIRSRILIFTSFNWNNYFKTNWIIVIVSILIGVASHLFWDSFTHDTGYFVNHISELKDSIYIYNKEIPVLKIAQHVSTIIGGLVIIFAISKLPKKSILTVAINRNYWIFILIFSISIIIIRIGSGLEIQQYGHLIASIISSILISLILTPLLLNSKLFRNK